MTPESSEPTAAADLEAFVRALPGPRSRLHHPAAMRDAERMILDAWREASWEVRRMPFTLLDVAGREDFGAFGHKTYPRLEGANLIAVREGDRPECIVVGAHFDTVRDSPGACDNGAALAVLVEVARHLGPLPSRLTVVLAAFDFEELGVLGARRAVADLSAEREVSTAIVLESIGWYDARPRTQELARGFGLLFPRVTQRLRRRGMPADWTALIYRLSARPAARCLAEEVEPGRRHEPRSGAVA